VTHHAVHAGGSRTINFALNHSARTLKPEWSRHTPIPTRLPVKLLGAVSLCRTCKGYGVSFATRSTVWAQLFSQADAAAWRARSGRAAHPHLRL